MFWRGELVISGAFGCISTQADSPAFEYHPREPKSGDAPRLDLVLCDGRPGDMIVLHGERLGSVYKELRCKIVMPGQPPLILDREVQNAKPSSCFIARLPRNVQACGDAKISVLVNAQLVSNEMPLRVLRPEDGPALPTQPIQARAAIPSLENSPYRMLDAPSEAPQPLAAGPMTTNRRQRRQARKDAPYPKTEPKSKPKNKPVQQDITLFAPTPSQWHLPPSPAGWNTAGTGFDYSSPLARPPLSRQSSEEMCQRLSSWLNDNASNLTNLNPLSLSRSNSKDLLGDCRTELSDSLLLPLSRFNSEEFVLAAGSVF